MSDPTIKAMLSIIGVLLLVAIALTLCQSETTNAIHERDAQWEKCLRMAGKDNTCAIYRGE